MQSISGLISSAAQPSISVKEPPQVQRPEGEAQARPLKPAMDEYVPEEKREPSGRYWLEQDENGQKTIRFDDPGQDNDVKGPEKESEKEVSVNTDKVDREIEELKKQRQELEQRLSHETDDVKRKELEAKLAQVERELEQKDSDAYRRQHAAYTYS